ncbi:uncharacterized protein LOC126749390 [Anthonomus grandis grandis]|uniref:uncharacterized protein LOC126749390 n=1 Tax=Anthonomus grandis grandis TaxID=2921223 RepID=UPI0021657CA8|nr:uncharacterized protein LOC126749390 [Anthonomus grandis grandis]
MARKRSKTRTNREKGSYISLKKSKSDHGRKSRSKLGKKRAKSDASVRSSIIWSLAKRGKNKKKNESETTTVSQTSEMTTQSELSVQPSMKRNYHLTSEFCPKTSADCLQPVAPVLSKEEIIYILVGFKLTVLLITMLGGAILAIMINATIMVGHRSRSIRMAIPEEDVVYPGERMAKSPIKYSLIVNLHKFQYRNPKNYEIINRHACINDHQKDRKSIMRETVVTSKCKFSTFYVNQYFHYSHEDKTFSKPKEIDNPDERMCLEVEPAELQPSELSVYLDDCSKGKKEQIWTVFPKWHIYNEYYNVCMTVRENYCIGEVIARPCTNQSRFSWSLVDAPKKPSVIWTRE